ncbi:Hypothetical protein OINT_2001248 [Brucella intermedia LMG 3301]|uniref:Uncharacterized protein n=1 Tax=Brucella intermedia LMG 3301 TaxID=641118 RepID=C4WNW4_9HYPH|nr:Hypothetical protein OINT_2001248 [Brucella intermedia LMG 3301]
MEAALKCPGKPGARFDRMESDRRSSPFYVEQHLVDPRSRIMLQSGSVQYGMAEPLRTFWKCSRPSGPDERSGEGAKPFRFWFVSAGLSIVAARHICSRVLNARASSKGKRLRLLFRQAGFK